MQLSINQTSAWITATTFKPFLLVGVAGISSIAIYSPISSQAQEIKNKLSNTELPLSPFTDKLITGSEKLFEQLGGWAKTGANASEEIKKWIPIVAKGNISNGTNHIFKTLKEWGLKTYGFLKTLWDKDIWEKFKKQAPLIANLLNLFKNLMKAEMNGNTSILSELFNAAGKEGFEEFVTTFSDMAAKQPEVLEQMNDENVGDLVNALKANPEQATEIMKNFADKPPGEAKLEDLMGALEPSILMGRIETALQKANTYKGRDSLKEEEKAEAKKLFEELKDLSSKLKQLIEKSKKT